MEKKTFNDIGASEKNLNIIFTPFLWVPEIQREKFFPKIFG
jgi:hypothetical protein